MSESLEVVSAEDANGRVLSGVGVDADALRETMERHAPAEAPEKPEAIAPADNGQPEAKPTRGSRRFTALEHERDEALKRVEAAEARAKEFETRLAAAPAPRSEPTPAPVAAPVVPPAVTRAKPLESEVGTKYESYPEFIEALQDWKDDQREAQRQATIDARILAAIEADRASQRHSSKVDEVISRGRKTYPDFDAVLQAPHMTAGNWPADKIQVIASLDLPETIQYQLGKDPVLAESLRTEPNLAMFGLRLAKLVTAAAVVSPASTAPTSSVAPRPYQPVGSGSKTTVTPSAELAKTGYDFDESGYRERRAAERGVFRKVK